MKKYVELLSILILIFALSGCSLINDDKSINEVKERANNAIIDKSESSDTQTFQDGDEPNNPDYIDYASPQYIDSNIEEYEDKVIPEDDTDADTDKEIEEALAELKKYIGETNTNNQSNTNIPNGFIKVNRSYGYGYYFINIQNIDYIEPYNDNNYRSRIAFGENGHTIYVIETPEEIMELINNQ